MIDSTRAKPRVLLIFGHPRRESLCGALAEAYLDGARRAGADTRTLYLSELSFAPDVSADTPENQTLEPDLEAAYADLEWAEHLVFVYPTWWGTMPALLKAFLDRLVMPGFAFRFYGPGATEWEGLWRGKSAQLITTMDTPPPIYNWLFKAPGTHAMRNATLGFCGVKPVHSLVCGAVRTSDAHQRARWIEQARRAGLALAHGVETPAGRAANRIKPWLAALRLQFYPMTFAAYTVGALAGARAPLNWTALLLGYLLLFCLEAATVFCNERFDFETDRRNPNHGPFTGGSRVLPDGTLDQRRLLYATGVLLIIILAAAALALMQTSRPLATGLWMLASVVLSLGYTVPPLSLSYRTLGEIDVAFTHSAMVLVLGALLQGGAFTAGLPWVISLPLALAILPSIVLAGVPDRAADAGVGKRTLAVRFGNAGALGIAAASTAAAAVLAVIFDATGLGDGVFTGLAPFAVIHGALILAVIWRTAQRDVKQLTRIDGLLVCALSYMMWFVIVPWINLA